MKGKRTDFTSLRLVILLGFLLGSTMVVSRFSIGQFDPLGYVAFRFILTSIILLPLTLFRTRALVFQRFSIWIPAVFVGIVGTALPFGAYISSLQYQSSGITSMLLTVTPIVTLLLAALFLKDEKITIRKSLGSFIGLGGAVLLIAMGETGLKLTEADMRGYLLVSVGIIGSATGIILLKKYLQKESILVISLIRSVSAAVLLSVIALATNSMDVSGVTLSGWLGLGYASIAGTVATIMLQAKIIAEHGPSRAAQAEYVTPLAASTLGIVFMGELISFPMVAGMMMIFFGLFILSKKDGPKVDMNEPVISAIRINKGAEQ
ncbi:MAG: DMT family transporter [Sphaerochaeta sp.]|nr:DMT family transporter [Sphaerochaeta sp.]